MTLKLSDFVNPTYQKVWVKPFIAAAERIAKPHGDLNIEYFPNEQLGKAEDQITGLNSGVFDMATVGMPYDTDATPMSNVMNLPRLASSGAQLTLAYYDLIRDPTSAIRKVDFDKNHMVPIMDQALPLYQVATAKQFPNTVEMVKGLRIRSGGGPQDEVIKLLGGTPTQVAGPDEYQALQRGILDGGIFNLPSLVANKTDEVVKYYTTHADLSSFNAALVVSDSKWGSLPQWAKDALVQAGKQTTEAFAKNEPKLVSDTIAQLKQKGLHQVTLSQATLNGLKTKLGAVIDQWVKDESAKGLPAAQDLTEAKKAIAAHAQ